MSNYFVKINKGYTGVHPPFYSHPLLFELLAYAPPLIVSYIHTLSLIIVYLVFIQHGHMKYRYIYYCWSVLVIIASHGIYKPSDYKTILFYSPIIMDYGM